MKTDTFTLITGASQGFGKALTVGSARRGKNLVLAALPGSGLPELALFLKRNYDVKVHIFEGDLTRSENCHALYTIVKEQDLKINSLINNAGILSRDYLENLTWDYLQLQMNLNMLTPTLLSKLFLPTLKQNIPSNILNVGSLACYFYLPGKQVYGATKAFILSFSQSLRRELKGSGVKVSVVCPGGMNTSASHTYQNRTAGWFTRQSIMNPEEVAEITLDKLMEGKEIIIPGKVNQSFLVLDKILPKYLKELITAKAMKNLNNGNPRTNKAVHIPHKHRSHNKLNKSPKAVFQ
ncbi:SDR family NAD(P)-dependent oxidoreductase [Robertkochia marina]|uniref:SDR family NAD(P)-dependent oxidoreductase n=1 Tax=Robertkochia marina TaxID=1227945 RepID=A0A4S3M413_9FLAO|nr:SDR family NAD(P)-dependent oxidoreductase [Robertkochia marina]THD69843.1 SDR family NAD(P)-dependent oxidoreductase [Robertkochia marina]TRZ46812.1 SDR family NAD(P)-dependent oxidoreductase [Robertkochia marina]